jgi:hypothetical protein
MRLISELNPDGSEVRELNLLNSKVIPNSKVTPEDSY